MSSLPPGPTPIAELTADQFAQRLAANFPNGWASGAAKQPGGIFYALLKSLGAELSFEQTGAAYAEGSTRIQTAVAPELDLAGQDYFGNLLPRNPGQSDASYASWLIANLPPAGATRQAIVDGLTSLTGVAPRVIEPWSPGDTGAWDTISYWDVDTQQNPFRWGGPKPYYGFIITPAPSLEILDGNPLLTWDDGGYWDIPGFAWFNTPSNNVQQIYALIYRMHVEGTIVGVQIGPTTSFVGGVPAFVNDGGVLQLTNGIGFPVAPDSLPAGAIYNNGLAVGVVPGMTPDPAAPPVFFNNITPFQLLLLGGGNLPLIPQTDGSGQLWNNGGEIAVS